MSSSTIAGSTARTRSVTIREAEAGDFERIGELTVDAYITGGFLTEQDGYVQHLRQVEKRAGSSTLLVAEVDSVVAGSVAVTDYDGEYAEVSLPGEMEFRMLAVAPEFQGHGVGRSLVRHIVGIAQSRQEITGVALCSLQAMTSAHALYRSEGFIQDPQRDLVVHTETMNARFPFFGRKVA